MFFTLAICVAKAASGLWCGALAINLFRLADIRTRHCHKQKILFFIICLYIWIIVAITDLMTTKAICLSFFSMSTKMKTDTILRTDGMRILTEHLGIVEAERFIAIIQREPFDYTAWRQDLFKDVPLNDFLDEAMSYRKNMK
jgi:hypothetical protein